jgi:hypothetical protein
MDFTCNVYITYHICSKYTSTLNVNTVHLSKTLVLWYIGALVYLVRKDLLQCSSAVSYTRNHLKINPCVEGSYCVGDKIEKNAMGGACSMYGGGERCVQGFGGET